MRSQISVWGFLAIAGAMAASISGVGQQNTVAVPNPAKMPKLGTVDARFASYNVEMVEVTGGRFWKPYDTAAEPARPAGAEVNQQVGVNPNLFQQRGPIDLGNQRLRNLARALSPSYVRVSGSWQNSTYFQNDDQPAMKEPPKGFRGVLTRAEWKGVVDFVHATDGEIVSSVAVSPGTRDAAGVWTPAQAKAFFDYTRSIGGTIAATEFMNEPTIPGPGGAPEGYDAAAYGRDAKLFGQFLRKESPKTTYLGPGSVAEGAPMTSGGSAPRFKLLPSDDLMRASGPIFDAFSYHFYGSVSHRCGGDMTADKAFAADWLDKTMTVEAFYANLRDKYLAGKPLWLTETAEAACGGDRIAAQFVDVFRYLNQLGAMAQKGVKVVMHNTLAASDYGLLDQSTLEPQPDYWATVLWKRTMGTTVLDPGMPAGQAVRVYAHCARGVPGGVALVALNTDPDKEQTIALDMPAERFTMTARAITDGKVLINGHEPDVAPDGTVGALNAERTQAGPFRLPAASATFLIVPGAANKACR